MKIFIIALFFFSASLGSSFAGDASRGERIAKDICSTCHRFGARFQTMNYGLTGPSLERGVYGRKVGQDDQFPYSLSLKKASEGGVKWNDDLLDPFLEKPEKVFRSTKMLSVFSYFRGLKDPRDREDVIAFLKTL